MGGCTSATFLRSPRRLPNASARTKLLKNLPPVDSEVTVQVAFARVRRRRDVPLQAGLQHDEGESPALLNLYLSLLSGHSSAPFLCYERISTLGSLLSPLTGGLHSDAGLQDPKARPLLQSPSHIERLLLVQSRNLQIAGLDLRISHANRCNPSSRQSHSRVILARSSRVPSKSGSRTSHAMFASKFVTTNMPTIRLRYRSRVIPPTALTCCIPTT